MAYVIAEACIGTKDTACVDACPVDCIHPKIDEALFGSEAQLYIDPVECIDCGACVPVCPVSAIFAADDLPDKWVDFATSNAAFFERTGSSLVSSPPEVQWHDTGTREKHNVFPAGRPRLFSDAKCVFISHRSSDKILAAAVAAYFDALGLLYWFDERDLMIQERMAKGDSYETAVVHGIDVGIKHSTEVLGIITPQVMGSWWVPYEIGAGRALGLGTAHLVLKTVASVPEYIQVSNVLWTSSDLASWAGNLAGTYQNSEMSQAALHNIDRWIRT